MYISVSAVFRYAVINMQNCHGTVFYFVCVDAAFGLDRACNSQQTSDKHWRKGQSIVPESKELRTPGISRPPANLHINTKKQKDLGNGISNGYRIPGLSFQIHVLDLTLTSIHRTIPVKWDSLFTLFIRPFFIHAANPSHRLFIGQIWLT